MRTVSSPQCAAWKSFSLAFLLLLAGCPFAKATDALITFSAFNNGTKLGDGVQKHITQEYQPLLKSYPGSSAANSEADGANLGITINWFKGSIKGAPRSPTDHPDHTGDFGKWGATYGGTFLFDSAPFSITFDKPVQIPSFFWCFHSGGPDCSAAIGVYTKASDILAIKRIVNRYVEKTGYIWKEEKGFADLWITKIVFERAEESASDNPLNIDDILVRSGSGK